MAKPIKNSPQQPATTIEDVLQRGIDGINLFIEAAKERLEVDSLDADLAGTLATVTQKVASVAAEQRKAEAAARKADEDMSPERMLDKIRRMSKQDRAQLLRQMQTVDADAGRSGLA